MAHGTGKGKKKREEGEVSGRGSRGDESGLVL